jgi:hypothetical protein
MFGIGGTPPLSPRQPAKSSEEEVQPLTPRRFQVTKTSPRGNFPITKAEAAQKRKEEKEKAGREPRVTERVPDVETIEVETVKIVSSPRRDVDKEPPVREGPKPMLEIRNAKTVPSASQSFKDKLRFFENLSKGGTTTTTATTTTTTSSPTDPSPRRDAMAVVPPMTPREPEKKT